MSVPENQPIIGILAGPTASGKSALAIQIALRHRLAIISADSMQVYRGLEIGTGAVLEKDRQGVPHHLLGIVEPTEIFQAARFVQAANRIAAEEWTRNQRRSLVVGGTGMWIEALREGIFDGPGRDQTIRDRLETDWKALGPDAMHARLAQVDPSMAEKLPPGDRIRVLRALEVWELSGRTLTDWYEEDQRRRQAIAHLLPLVVITHPREDLYRRIETRVDQMIADGWIQEARMLAALDLPPGAPAAKALGYRELIQVVRGEITIEEAIPAIKQATRNYAKRQLTWFRHQRDVQILESPTVEDIENALGV